ncbi:MAG: hypothetical protein IJ157_11500 [Clostridia bacterium]|nr:hypothetical protein [Clostridia bacterium]
MGQKFSVSEILTGVVRKEEIAKADQEDALAGCKGVTVLAPEGSYAEGWAKSVGLAVEHE